LASAGPAIDRVAIDGGDGRSDRSGAADARARHDDRFARRRLSRAIRCGIAVSRAEHEGAVDDLHRQAGAREQTRQRGIGREAAAYAAASLAGDER